MLWHFLTYFKSNEMKGYQLYGIFQGKQHNSNFAILFKCSLTLHAQLSANVCDVSDCFICVGIIVKRRSFIEISLSLAETPRTIVCIYLGNYSGIYWSNRAEVYIFFSLQTICSRTTWSCTGLLIILKNIQSQICSRIMFDFKNSCRLLIGQHLIGP